MAERANKENQGDNENQNKEHNLTAMLGLMGDAVPKIFEKEQQIKKALELHVDHLKSDLSKIWKNLKADTGQDLKYLRAAYKLYKLQEEAKLMVEEDDRDKALDAIRLAMSALKKGEHLDFLKALDGEDTKTKTPAKSKK